jgi:hypothetical protein
VEAALLLVLWSRPSACVRHHHGPRQARSTIVPWQPTDLSLSHVMADSRRVSTASSPTLDERRLHDASSPTREAQDNLAEREMHEEGGDEPQDPPPKQGRGDPPEGGPPPPDDQDPNEVTWGPDDPANPLNWTSVCHTTYLYSSSCRFSRNSRKWWITTVASLATVTCTFASSAPSAAVLAFSQDFGVSEAVSNLITTLFLGVSIPRHIASSAYCIPSWICDWSAHLGPRI